MERIAVCNAPRPQAQRKRPHPARNTALNAFKQVTGDEKKADPKRTGRKVLGEDA